MAWSLPDGCVLGFWCDRPDASSKPSMLESLGESATSEILSAALLDRLDFWNNPAILGEGGRKVVVFGPSDAGPWFDERVPASYALQAQETGELGSRVSAFFDGEFAEGATKVVLLIGESPFIDPTLVVSAFLCLDRRDLVLGPRTDGGVYLIGARGRIPNLSTRVNWNVSTHLSELVELIGTDQATLTCLPPWYGLESARDWEVLRGHLRAALYSGMPPALPRLEALVAARGTDRLEPPANFVTD